MQRNFVVSPVKNKFGDRRDQVSGAKALGPLFLHGCLESYGRDCFAFVQQLRERLKRLLLVICARFSGHHEAVRLLSDLYGTRIHAALLPAYASELNVVEHCWGHTKYGERANFIPPNIDDLAQEVADSLIAKYQRPNLLQALFQHAKLEM